MASICRICRLSTRRLTSIHARGFRTTSICNDAHNFNMPALSPTMTEGTISSWKLKEGDSFSAGDIILEVETDKAQMDVEAPDDGVLAKIMIQSGKSPIKVGQRIAIIADPGDDISTLSIPSESTTSTPPPTNAPESSTQAAPGSSTPAGSESPASTPTERHVDKAGLRPSPGIVHLLHKHNLDMADVKGTGPKGRVLKGDVLAHVGEISREKPGELATWIAKLARLDLSGVKAVKTEKKEEKVVKKTEEVEKVDVPRFVDIGLPISMKSVVRVQRKLHRQFGTEMTWNTFFSRAVYVANQDLPKSQEKRRLTADEVFDELVGEKTYDDSPFLYAYVREPVKVVAPAAKVDVLDVLIGKAPATRSITRPAVQDTERDELSVGVTVPAADEERGRLFLSRLKFHLESVPQSLISAEIPLY